MDQRMHTVCTYNRIVFHFQVEGNSDTCDKMDEY